MTKCYMITAPREMMCKKSIKVMLNENDCKRWIVAREQGKNGYKHWQIRIETSNRNFWNELREKGRIIGYTGWFAKNFPGIHCEECTDNWTYERKEHDFWAHDDTCDIHKIRHGKLSRIQKWIIRELKTQSDREIDVWYDTEGNHGKTWLTLYLYEHGRALVVPRSAVTPEKMSAYVCSAYKGEEFIIIDIPRARRIDKGLYESIEELKDGLVFDTRYTGKARNIRGVKIVIFTNTKLDTKQLSHDRWRLHGITPPENEKAGSP